MISRKDAYLARKARADQQRLQRQAHYLLATAGQQEWITWRRDVDFKKIPWPTEHVPQDVEAKFARDQEAELAALVASEREQAVMLGLSLGSGT